MSNRRAFTLVELLVVIGIIALLISILLPALNRAREQAWRVVCLSGVRELGQALRIYATENNDYVPIGYMDQHNFNYFVNWNNPNGTKVTMLGFLPLSGLTPSPRAFYCPAVRDQPSFMYDTPQNPWPPFENYPNHPRFTTPGLGHTRITYMTRPIANWPTNARPWGNTPGTAGYHFPYLGTKWNAHIANPSGDGLAISMPKFSSLKNKAILTELIISHHWVLRTHKSGINVYYANGSGQWVDLSWVSKPIPFGAPLWSEQDVWRKWQSIPEAGAFSNPNTYNDYFLVESDHYGGPSGHTIAPHLLPTGVWINLDNAMR